MVYLGLIDTLDFMWEQRVYCIQEKSRKPWLSRSYHRIVRKDGELLRIDTFSGRKLTCTRLFLYENNTRYCFPKYYAPCQMPVLAEVVRWKDDFVEESYALTDNVLSFDRYCKQNDGTVAIKSFQFWPKVAPHIREEYQGFFRVGKRVRYQETDCCIAPFQRNEGSRSQSMLIRFMDGVPLMEPDTELVSGGMGGIIEQVANYRNTTASIGFSFRFYMEGMIQNPNVKLLSVDGVAPTVENIQNGTYPITTPLYAVTFESNDNPNVEILLAWVLSEEGQLIIQKTGYVPLQ